MTFGDCNCVQSIWIFCCTCTCSTFTMVDRPMTAIPISGTLIGIILCHCVSVDNKQFLSTLSLNQFERLILQYNCAFFVCKMKNIFELVVESIDSTSTTTTTNCNKKCQPVTTKKNVNNTKFRI